jgi:cation diffusion facilitator CzcD-associated flavoprotein CzcO
MTTADRPDPLGADELGFDPDELRARYRVERDRRLRPDGAAQYIAPTGDFGYYAEDPCAAADFSREALDDGVDVVIIGGGFGGLLIGARLRQAGVESIRVIEKAGDFGGTWYWNRYPGVRCDIESYIYLPLLEEVGFVPTEKYCRGQEILEHAQAIARKFDLYRDACFQTEVTDLSWDDSDARWTIRTNRDDRVAARYVIFSSGPFDRAKLPGIPGIDTFGGHTFHTSRWDYGYTGGDATGGLHKLRDKRVAVIGTGATAIQCVPLLAEDAEHLFVFQRTPSSVDVRDNRPTDPAWAAALTPGWQQRRRDNFLALVSGGRQDEDLVGDRWTDVFHRLNDELANVRPSDLSPAQVALTMEIADFKKMNEIRARVDAVVHDEATAEALKPWYRGACKRPTFSDEYLPTFNRPNVTLVDTEGRGVERITERGLVSGGVEYEVDCVVFATGFQVGAAYLGRSGPEIYGRGGVTLAEHWRDGLRTLHGFASHGFPNLFRMGASQNAVAVNFLHILDEQAVHIAEVVARAEEVKARCVEPTAEAEAAWVAEIRQTPRPGADILAECTPGYYNNEGMPQASGGGYGGGAVEFHQLLKRWRDNGMADVLPQRESRAHA